MFDELLRALIKFLVAVRRILNPVEPSMGDVLSHLVNIFAPVFVCVLIILGVFGGGIVLQALIDRYRESRPQLSLSMLYASLIARVRLIAQESEAGHD